MPNSTVKPSPDKKVMKRNRVTFEGHIGDHRDSKLSIFRSENSSQKFGEPGRSNSVQFVP